MIFFAVLFFQFLPKLIDFVNSDDCIEKIALTSIRLFQFFIEKKFEMLGFSFALFFEILPKIIDFVNSDDCIEKKKSKSIRLQPVFIKKYLKLIKKQIVSIEKIINLGNYIHDYENSFFGEDF